MSQKLCFALGLAICISILSAARAETTAEANARELLRTTDTKGGLCLVLGSRDADFAMALAGQSALYVQVLQPDIATALQWGAAVASSDLREQVGVRNATFVADHYGSDLFNLILLEDPAALGAAKAADIFRMLVPNGIVAVRNAGEITPEAAQAAGLAATTLPGFAVAFRKPVKPRSYEFCNSIRWRAGARAQWSSGWRGYGSAGEVFYYTERLEVPGVAEKGSRRWDWARSMLQVRDAWNGRLLWTQENADVLAGTAEGRLFVINSRQKLELRDGHTGILLKMVSTDGAEKNFRMGAVSGGGVVILWGEGWMRGFGSDGTKLWTQRYSDGGRAVAVGANLYFTLDRGGLTACTTRENKQLWTAKNPGGSMQLSDKYVHLCDPGLVNTFDQASGRTVWSRTNVFKVPKGWAWYTFPIGDRLYFVRFHPYPDKKQFDSSFYLAALDIATGKEVLPETSTHRICAANMCTAWARLAGDKILYWFNVWLDPKTMKEEYTFLAHPSCFFGTYLANGMAYNFPSRKAGPLAGISASAPADITFDHEPGGKLFEKYADVPANGPEPTPDDWPMFRGNPTRSNATSNAPGSKLTKLWEVSLGLGTKTFGQMCSIRSGLTQPVVAYGLAVVADMEGQRIVALDAATGKTRWIFHTGSRVEFSPSLTKGLCLFAAKDGFVYCLNAATGALCWKRQIPARTRLIGGQDKLESVFSVTSDVLVNGGVGYACAGLNGENLGGLRAIAFKPDTGNLVWTQCYTDSTCGNIFVGDPQSGKVRIGNAALDLATGKHGGGAVGGLTFGRWWAAMDDYLAGGVSLPRNGEDRAGVCLHNQLMDAKTLAWDSNLSAGFYGVVGGELWGNGILSLYAKNKRGRENLWEVKDDLIVDDLVVTPNLVYAVGHHYSTPQEAELRALARENGSTLASYPLNTQLPAWNGASVAGGRVFIATGEGKLLCFGARSEAAR